MTPTGTVSPFPTCATRRRGAHRAPEVRTLHLVDLENLMGAVRTAVDVADVWSSYTATMRLDRSDHVVVGTGPALAATAWFVLPARGLRRVVGRGLNGGDLALLEAAADTSLVARTYQRLVIASGDGIFTGLADRYRAAGLEVVQVVGRGRPHPVLAAHCDRQLCLPVGLALAS